MIALPAEETLRNIYSDVIAERQDELRRDFSLKVDGIASQNRTMETMGERALTPAEIETAALTEMARNLSYYRESSRSILTSYKDGKFTAPTAVSRTNQVIAELTALRKLFADFNPSRLNNVLHARLDERVLHQQELICSKLKKVLNIRDNLTVAFDEVEGIVLR